MTALVLSAPIFGQAPAGPERKVDYQGFYDLNIPGFTWAEGAQVSAEFRRIRGVLNLDHSRQPVFLSEGHDPVILSVDQTSRLLLAFETDKPFELEGMEARATQKDGSSTTFFVALRAVSGDRTVNLIPTPKTPAQGNAGPGRGSGPGTPPPRG